MFELASANDLIELKAKYLDKLYPEESQWGLKQFGTLFCYEQLRNQKGRFLEIGAGQNRFFDEHLDAKIDYWVVDSSGFYDAAKYKHSASLRKRTTLIDGMIGQFLPALPSESFDAIFSVSVLEHVPVARISDVCKDMYRLLKRGGYLIHSIDLTPGNYESIGSAFLRELQALGLRFLSKPNVDYSRVAYDGILIEPIPIVFKYYFGQRSDPWKNPHKINQHTSSIKVVVQK